MDLNIIAIPPLVMICYLMGVFIKTSTIDNKWIPVCCMIVGALLGIISYKFVPALIGADILTSVATGIMSGLTSTGVNQLIKQTSSGV